MVNNVAGTPLFHRSRGFGFITYALAASIEDAQANRPHTIDGRQVETKRAMPRRVSGPVYTHGSLFHETEDSHISDFLIDV